MDTTQYIRKTNYGYTKSFPTTNPIRKTNHKPIIGFPQALTKQNTGIEPQPLGPHGRHPADAPRDLIRHHGVLQVLFKMTTLQPSCLFTVTAFVTPLAS